MKNKCTRIFLNVQYVLGEFQDDIQYIPFTKYFPIFSVFDGISYIFPTTCILMCTVEFVFMCFTKKLS